MVSFLFIYPPAVAAIIVLCMPLVRQPHSMIRSRVTLRQRPDFQKKFKTVLGIVYDVRTPILRQICDNANFRKILR